MENIMENIMENFDQNMNRFYEQIDNNDLESIFALYDILQDSESDLETFCLENDKNNFYLHLEV